jgi:hypothetical protein
MGKISQWSGTFSKTGLPVITFDPTFFGASLVAWYKADAGVTSAAGLISAIADYSATGLALGAAAGAQYTLLAAMQNGLPGMENTEVSTSSTNQQLAAFGNIPAVLRWNYTQPFTVALAFRQNAPLYASGDNNMFGNVNPTFGGGANSGNGWAVGTAENGSGLAPGLKLIYNDNSLIGAYSVLPSNLVVGSSYIAQFANSGTGAAAGISGRLNGQTQSLVTAKDTLAGNNITPSASTNFGFNPSTGSVYRTSQNSFFEAIVVNRLLTMQERASLDAYLNKRWAIF